jgi:lipoate-protein ligase A
MTHLEHPSQEWRLILNSPASGAWNMAVDESILEAVGRHEAPPTLRLYAWDPPCLSLGYAQPLADVDLTRLHTLGWDIVRRPTGGRAILHTDELTYSIIGSYDESLLKGNLLESYNAIARGLLAALQEIEIEASMAFKDGSPSQAITKQANPICFESPSRYEITVNQKKLIGSAQARRRDGVLQHGTLPLDGDISRITQVLAFGNETERQAAAERVRARATTVAEILNRPITWATAARAFVSGFEKNLGLNLVKSDLTMLERQRAEDLLKSKYDVQKWTFK